MKRRDFIKRFSVGAAAAVAAPSIVKAALPDPDPGFSTTTFKFDDGRSFELADIPQPELDNRHEWAKRRYPMRTDECYRSQWDEIAEREFFRPYWPKLVERYGNVNILDMLKIIS